MGGACMQSVGLCIFTECARLCAACCVLGSRPIASVDGFDPMADGAVALTVWDPRRLLGGLVGSSHRGVSDNCLGACTRMNLGKQANNGCSPSSRARKQPAISGSR